MRIYEINTAVFLAGRRLEEVDWGFVPDVDAVWLMGVWERSPAGLAIALDEPGLMAGMRAALPDLRDEDVIGSPYCVRDYVVDARFGDLAAARAALAARGLKLILDYVPNHVAPDHPWLASHPEYFIRGHRGRPRARSGVVAAGGRRRSSPAGAIRTSRRGRTSSSSTRSRRRCARRCASCWSGSRAVRRRALRHGDADDQRGLLAHLGAGGARRRSSGRTCHAIDELVVHRRGLLGHGVRAPAAGLRLLLRQAALRPARARGRRVGARASAGGSARTRSGCCASSRTTTSRGRRRRSARGRARRRS